MAAADEVKRILSLTKDDPAKAYELVQGQFSVLVLRAQVMLSLSGIVITVTGFSGRTIAQTSVLARVLVSSGIVIVLLAAAMALGGVLRLRWLTQEITDDPETTRVRMLDLRDRRSRWLASSLVVFIAGFACYCFAIALMLLATPSLG